jgi:hypothetical protein
MRVAISGMMRFRQQHHSTRKMNATRRNLIMQRWNVVQHELLPELRNELGWLTPKLEKVIHTLVVRVVPIAVVFPFRINRVSQRRQTRLRYSDE